MGEHAMRSRRAGQASALLPGMLALLLAATPTVSSGEPITIGYFPAWGVYDT